MENHSAPQEEANSSPFSQQSYNVDDPYNPGGPTDMQNQFREGNTDFPKMDDNLFSNSGRKILHKKKLEIYSL